MEKYAFTMKINYKLDPTVYDYEGILTKWRDKGVVIDKYSYEREPNDSKKLHIHGIVFLTKNFFRKSLKEYGVHFHLKKMYDEPGWIAYCKKDEIPNSDIIK